MLQRMLRNMLLCKEKSNLHIDSLVIQACRDGRMHRSACIYCIIL